MKCVVCKKGQTKTGKATVTLEKEGTTLVFKGVPARVCTNCGEEYVDEKTTARLLKTATDAGRAGVQVEIRRYSPVSS
jgi:YgiT-type zinc finger domain-containing protein